MGFSSGTINAVFFPDGGDVCMIIKEVMKVCEEKKGILLYDDRQVVKSVFKRRKSESATCSCTSWGHSWVGSRSAEICMYCSREQVWS